MKKLVNIIVAIAKGNAIGRNGDLICRLRPDMLHFKAITTGNTVIMGRKTWESLPAGALPDRRNIVVSRNKDYKAEGAEVFCSLDEAIAAASTSGNEIFIIGGEQIYRQAMHLAHRIYLTRIDFEAPDADTFFPEIDDALWREETSESTAQDPRTGINYQFVCLLRK